MSIQELTQVLEQELAATEEMLKQPAEGAPPAEAAPAEAAPAPAPADVAPEMPMSMTPALIQEATSILVGMGLMDAATAQMTPELMTTLQALADTYAPGLFDLQNPDEMEEFLDGIINGTITLAAPPAAPAGIPAPAGLPGAVPAGLVPPAGAAPAGSLPPGLPPGPLTL